MHSRVLLEVWTTGIPFNELVVQVDQKGLSDPEGPLGQIVRQVFGERKALVGGYNFFRGGPKPPSLPVIV
jgi:hypothetical protein